LLSNWHRIPDKALSAESAGTHASSEILTPYVQEPCGRTYLVSRTLRSRVPLKIAQSPRYFATLNYRSLADWPMRCVCQISSSLNGIPSNRRRSSSSPIVVAIVSVFMIASTQAFGLTIADLDPSRRYKLEKIDLSGEHAFPREVVLSVMTTKERPRYQVWKPLPDFDTEAFTEDLAHIRRFYEAHGYYNAHLTYDLSLSKDKVTPHIKVSEGKPIRIETIEIEVANRSPSPQELDRSFKLPLKKDDVFDQDAHQKGA
jgi:hypothetical protein